MSHRKNKRMRKQRNSVLMVLDSEANEHQLEARGKWMLRPDSPKRLLWDLVGGAFVVYDIIYVPLSLLDFAESSATGYMMWMTRVFWTLDMPASVLTGYFRPDGEMETRPSHVCYHYLKTWFWPDIAIVVSDWSEVFFGVSSEGSDAARLGKAIRLVRLCRVLRLMQQSRMGDTIDQVFTWMSLPEVACLLRAGLSVGKILALILVVVHIISCVWCKLGTSGGGGRNWATEHGVSSDDLAYFYLTSVHWSMTQFVGTMEVGPTNLHERIFAVMVLFFAFVMSAAFVSSITTSMTRYTFESSEQVRQVMQLRMYLMKSRISQQLIGRLLRNAQHAISESRRDVKEADVELLRLVSEPLRSDLHLELYAPTLSAHAFFKRSLEQNPVAMRKICHSAISVESLCPGDIVFCEHDAAPATPCMFFVWSGSLTYEAAFSERGSTEDLSLCTGAQTVLRSGDWACEPALWVEWSCFWGTLRARTASKLLMIDAQKFQEIASQFCVDGCDMKLYAQAFAARLSSTPCDRLTDIHTLIDINAIMESVFFQMDLRSSGPFVRRNT